MLSRDEPDGCLLIGLVVSGMKVARARSGLHNGTGELLDAKRCLLVEVDARRVQNPVACQEGGTPRSSGEASVMGAERRGRVVGFRSLINQ
jgi:hypothetical protein